MLDVMRVYNLDAPSPRKSLILKSEHFICAVNIRHGDKSLHLMNKVVSDICQSLVSPSLEVSGSNAFPPSLPFFSSLVKLANVTWRDTNASNTEACT